MPLPFLMERGTFRNLPGKRKMSERGKILRQLPIILTAAWIFLHPGVQFTEKSFLGLAFFLQLGYYVLALQRMEC